MPPPRRAPLGRRDGNAPLPPRAVKKGLGGSVAAAAATPRAVGGLGRAAAPSVGGGPPRMAQGPVWAFRSPAPESWAAAPSPLQSPAPISAANVAIAPGLHEVRLSETRRPPPLPPCRCFRRSL